MEDRGALSQPGVQHQQAGQDGEHQRADHERGPQNRAKPYLHPLLSGAEENRDDRNGSLRQRGPDRREDAADRPIRHLQALSQPFDPVCEEITPPQRHDHGGEQQGNIVRNRHEMLQIYFFLLPFLLKACIASSMTSRTGRPLCSATRLQS